MKSVLVASLLLMVVGHAPAFAHHLSPCQPHGNNDPAESQTVADCAVEMQRKLVAKGGIEASWKDTKVQGVEQITGKLGKEWRVTFRNPAASEKQKDTLYMFFTLSGRYIAINFTGE